MHFKDFKNIILKFNEYDLPGHELLLKIAPPSRIKHLKTNKIPINSKLASVLLLFYPDSNNHTRLVLILRNTYNGVHSNQIGFPGGKLESTDKSYFEAALRETNEEIGVLKENISYVGQLSQVYIPPSNFNVFPFVGFCNSKPQFELNKVEVKSILEPTLDSILKCRISKSKVIINDKLQYVPSLVLNESVVWGATAIMIHEFRLLFKQMINS